MTRLAANGLPVLIGSIPLDDHARALELVLEYTPEIPLWPQLPGLAQEGMLVQFLEGFPGVDEESGKPRIDTESGPFQEGMLAFFEDYLAVEEDFARLADSRFAISRDRAQGLYRLVEAVRGRQCLAVKGQTTGPFTLLVGITDQEGRLAYYDPTLREMLVKGTACKAAWQVNFLRQTGRPAICFLDEPALAGLGSSAYISIAKEDIKADLAEVIAAIHRAGGLAGIHVCANTDWDLILALDLDIVNFDAFGFFDRFVASKKAIVRFLDRGGIIAWGGVPTGDPAAIDNQTPEGLAELWQRHMAALTGPDRDLAGLLAQTLVTPSCGTGSLDLDHAVRVLALTRETSRILRQRFLPAA